MSELVRRVKSYPTGKFVAKKRSLSDIMRVSETLEPQFDSAMQHYKIKVEFGAQVAVDDYNVANDPRCLEQAIRTVKNSIVEYVFGEFRRHFREIEMTLMDDNTDEALRKLRAFETQMFEVYDENE